MDDARLANLLFLAGFASLAIPGCGDVGEPGVAPAGGAPGNPLSSDNSLSVDGDDACTAYVAKLIECGGYSDDEDDYGNSDDYYGASAAPGYAAYCDVYLGALAAYAGPACVTATVEYFSCLSGLSCEALLNDESACRQKLFAAAGACEGGGVEDVDE
ncbi:MAG: hypothetical protein KUG77_29955 [Nannocystaceae bacterium]|nr:hypothetical protein [Nannocystaceae bacterium]